MGFAPRRGAPSELGPRTLRFARADARSFWKIQIARTAPRFGHIPPCGGTSHNRTRYAQLSCLRMSIPPYALILLLFACIGTLSQPAPVDSAIGPLPGIFRISNGYGYIEIRFAPDSSFEYKYGGCVGTYGTFKSTFELTENILTLHIPADQKKQPWILPKRLRAVISHKRIYLIDANLTGHLTLAPTTLDLRPALFGRYVIRKQDMELPANSGWVDIMLPAQ